MRIRHGGSALVHHREDNALKQTVGGLDAGGIGKVSLKGVGDNIGDAAGGLEGRQALGQSGVHNGELGSDAVGLGRGLVESLLMGDDCVGGAFTAGSGESEYDADG